MDHQDADARPLLLVDVDGPLNPYAAKPGRRPEGYATHRLLPPRWEAAERLRLATWGTPHKRVKPLRVWLNSAHGAQLAALPYELAWATTWEDEANTYLAPLLGLPDLPVVRWSAARDAAPAGVFWKTPELVAWAAGRPFAWIDDEITDADRAWVEARHGAPALLLRIDPRLGLRAEDFAVLREWAR